MRSASAGGPAKKKVGDGEAQRFLFRTVSGHVAAETCLVIYSRGKLQKKRLLTPRYLSGLLGAEDYVYTLPQSELDKIRLYLNFDMIASPNFVYVIYDGDGSAFGTTGPPGSVEVEKLWEGYFKKDAGLATNPSEFDGRSDYGPFLEYGIAAGGLTSGADGVKTEEDVVKYGGTAGIIYDPNYHTANDTLKNLNVGPWIQISKGIAHAVATYGRSFESLPAKTKREVGKREVSGFKRKGGKWVI